MDSLKLPQIPLQPIAPRLRIELCADLQEQLAKPSATRKQFLDKLYSHSITKYVSGVLSRDKIDDDILQPLERMIASLDARLVHTSASLQFSFGASFAAHLPLQCPPLKSTYSKNIEELCSAFSAVCSEYPVEWSFALPILRADRLEEHEVLLRALFERGEWLNASSHLFVVPFLVGSESDIDLVDTDVREFCVYQQQNGGIVIGRVAHELLQVHGERSAQVATQCIRLVCEWGDVWTALKLSIEWAERKESAEIAAELDQRVRDIHQIIHSEKWRLEQRDLLIALTRCKQLWQFPVDERTRWFSVWHTIRHKFFLFGLNDEYYWREIMLISEKMGLQKTSQMLIKTLQDMLLYCVELMDIFEYYINSAGQCETDSQRTIHKALLHIQLQQDSIAIHLREPHNYNHLQKNNAATRLLDFWTLAIRMQCKFLIYSYEEGHSAFELEATLRVSLRELPFARCAALALRSCVQCCSVWSLLERSAEWAALLNMASESADELVEAVKAISAKIRSAEWCAEMKRNLATAFRAKEIWFYSAPYYRLETLWEHCFLYENDSGLFDRLHVLLNTIRTSTSNKHTDRYLRFTVKCLCQLIQLSVEMFEEIGHTISNSQQTNTALNDFLQNKLKNIKIENVEEERRLDYTDANAITLLLGVLMKAISFQEESNYRELLAPYAKLDAHAEVPLSRCLPLVFRMCLRCSPALNLLKWTIRWLCDEKCAEKQSLACIAALSEAMHSPDWRAEQQREFAPAIRQRDIWLYPQADDELHILSTRCFIFAPHNDLCVITSLLERGTNLSSATREKLFQLTCSLLEFGADIMRKLQSRDDASLCELHNPTAASPLLEHITENDSLHTLIGTLSQTLMRKNSIPIDLSLMNVNERRSYAATRMLDFWANAISVQRKYKDGGNSGLELSLLEPLQRLPFAKCVALALRPCMQCCSVWSLLERCTDSLEFLKCDQKDCADELVEAVETIRANIQSDEWRAEVKRNLYTALSIEALWLFKCSEEQCSTLWTHCFIFEGRTGLFYTLSELINSNSNQNNKCLRAIFSCVCQLLKFCVEIIEESRLTMSREVSKATLNESSKGESNRKETDKTRHVKWDSFDDNASSLLFKFLAEAISFQESFRSESPESSESPDSQESPDSPKSPEFPTWPEIHELAEIPIGHCLSLAVGSCLRCSPVLQVISGVLDWVCGFEHLENAGIACVDAISEAIQEGSEWREEQQRRFNALLLHRSFWIYPLANGRDELGYTFFLFEPTFDESFVKILFINRPAMKTVMELDRIMYSLLEFSLQLMQQLQSPPAESTAVALDWDPKRVKLIKNPKPENFFDCASVFALICKKLNDLVDCMCLVKMNEDLQIHSLRLRILATFTGLLFEQLVEQSEGTVCVFDFRYSKDFEEMCSVLSDNLYFLKCLNADDIARLTEFPEVELVYKETLLLLWTLTHPVKLISETACANEQQTQSIKKFKTNFEKDLYLYSLVTNLMWSVRTQTKDFCDVFSTHLQKGISKINEIFYYFENGSYSSEENWGLYLKLYNEMLDRFYHLPSSGDYTVPFTVPYLVVPCLILSEFELPCELVSILREHEQEAAVFNLHVGKKVIVSPIQFKLLNNCFVHLTRLSEEVKLAIDEFKHLLEQMQLQSGNQSARDSLSRVSSFSEDIASFLARFRCDPTSAQRTHAEPNALSAAGVNRFTQVTSNIGASGATIGDSQSAFNQLALPAYDSMRLMLTPTAYESTFSTTTSFARQSIGHFQSLVTSSNANSSPEAVPMEYRTQKPGINAGKSSLKITQSANAFGSVASVNSETIELVEPMHSNASRAFETEVQVRDEVGGETLAMYAGPPETDIMNGIPSDLHVMPYCTVMHKPP